MLTVKDIYIHHAGGSDSNPLASSQHLTFKDIDEVHRTRKDFIGYKAHKSSMGSYCGYNVVYTPSTRTFKQARTLGEETLAQTGANFQFSLCIIGNYTKGADTLHPYIVEDVTAFLDDLINGNKRGLIVTPNITLELSVHRIFPHRKIAPHKDCYGDSIPDRFFTVELLKRKLRLLPLAEFLAWLRTQPPVVTLAGHGHGECEGFI